MTRLFPALFLILSVLEAPCCCNAFTTPSSNTIPSQRHHDVARITKKTNHYNNDAEPFRLLRAEGGAAAITSRSAVRLHQSSDSETEEKSSFSLNVQYAIGWVALVAWAFSPLAPGSLGSDADTAMLNAIIADPVHPAGMNELYYAVFNFFAVIPLLLAALALPQAPVGKGLPATPFIAGSAGIGYFAMGPYLTFKPQPINDISEKQGTMNWFTRNVLENKLFAGFLLAFTGYLFVGGGNVIEAYQVDNGATLWQGFVDLATSSRFAAVSLADLFLLYLSCVSLTVQDYMIRSPDSTEQEAQNVALATAVLPLVGSILYLVFRPSLPLQEGE